MVKPKDSAALVAFNAKQIPEGFERLTIRRVDGPTLRFHGRLLGDTVVGQGARRLELGLWETPAGAWVAAKCGFSEYEEERPLERAIVIDPGIVQTSGPFLVMDFWEWSNPARSLARKLGWHLEEFVE